MKTTLLLTLSLLLAGCATTKSFVVTGGDRAGGSVTLTCFYDLFTTCDPTPTPDMNNMAAQACSSWGYSSAKAFGGFRRVPTDEYSGNIEVNYQCLGDLER